jgi:hypothetical protein
LDPCTSADNRLCGQTVLDRRFVNVSSVKLDRSMAVSASVAVVVLYRALTPLPCPMMAPSILAAPNRMFAEDSMYAQLDVALLFTSNPQHTERPNGVILLSRRVRDSYVAHIATDVLESFFVCTSQSKMNLQFTTALSTGS